MHTKFKPRKPLEVILDTFYAFFQPLRWLLRSPTYRVKYTYDGGMTALEGEKTFEALSDFEARRKAREIAGGRYDSLESYRPIK